jgi:hypothetical protein
MKKQTKKVVNYIREKCREDGVKVFIYKNKENLKDKTGTCYSGEFDCEKRFIKLAIKGDEEEDWIPVLIHEFCHFIQWKRGTKAWKKVENYKNYNINGDLSGLIFNWVMGKIEIPKKDLRKIISRLKDMELECERMTIKFIKKFNLKIDTKEYCKSAALYIYFYDIVRKYRMWNELSLDINEDDWHLLPNNLNNKFKKLPKKIEKLILETKCQN